MPFEKTNTPSASRRNTLGADQARDIISRRR